MARLFVIAGHGAGDPGACAHGYTEAERVRALAQFMATLGGDAVTLGDFDRDYYADGGVSNLDLPEDYQVVELHMDSGGPGACGGHVIINAGFEPDEYDTALANYIGSYFPGRSEVLVQRDLTNAARAAAVGVPYRLLEVCFISNQGDLDKFNADLSGVASGILQAFGIGVHVAPVHVPSHSCQLWSPNGTDAQKWYMRDNKDGTSSLRNASSWSWLSDPNSSHDNYTPAEVWGGDGNDNPRGPQRLVITKTSRPGVYSIHPECAPEMALDVRNASMSAGAVVQWYEANGTRAQQWMLYELDDGGYRIVNVGSWLPLDVVGGGL